MKIEKVAVLGAGVMGAQIAAHLVNAGLDVLLLDILPPGVEPKPKSTKWGHSLASAGESNKVALAAIEGLRKMKPAPLFVPELAELIRVGNFEEDLHCISQADWIIEAVVEKLDIKRALFEKVDKYRRQGSIVSSNTSGISIKAMAEGRSEDFRKHFLGTHFFNPPRYMKLLEIIPAPETLPEVITQIAQFCEKELGKGVVYAKDTPNFIANRIGTFGMMYTMRVMIEDGYTVEEVDKITGPAVGRPKTASFRTADLVGLDTLVLVARNVYSAAVSDKRRDMFEPLPFLSSMVEKKMLGNKTNGGFYKKVKAADGDQIMVVDLSTLEYRPQQKVNFPSLEAAKNVEDLRERLRMLVYGSDRVGAFLWKVLSETFLYTAELIPEIADDICQVDNAMKWGFNWELGIFEAWDACGVERSVEKMRQEGRQIPELAEKLLAAGCKSFYKKENGYTFFFDLQSGGYKKIDDRPGVILLPALKDRQKVIKRNPGASLIDLGDGVACLEFHSKMNSIGADTVSLMNFAVKEVEQNFEGLVIGNQGENFSAGANLMLLLLAAQEGEWEEIDLMVRSFQNVNCLLRYSEKPVVVAPFGLTLGGGCEITMHGDRACAAAETYIGLVEVGVGLIPAGGGTKEMLVRATERAAIEASDADLFPYIKQAFEAIATAKVATSAAEARKYGYLRKSDRISMNKDRLIEDAKQTVLAMVREGYRKPQPRQDIPALGQSALAALKLGIHIMVQGGFATEYEGKIATKVAYILTGGDLSRETKVSEQYLLDLEREAFLSLCGERKTQERIQHMLKTGKPLRN
ncbi:MAG: 3-hydroxyacyl-CoA dehydrogenase/enoyl-CoA hydratase family protein [Acidobacteriota bacterium]|nr:3-hydroxyacyl-CoA dehydrogenase/enoyl-CoA hydratase family protein [Blastocatellia bacterium]MDW8412854.1 3-hydroxyacyl-CoA dehydrogenase/enoyl-CoA hydratase family protein [Acidobacteriota bacterium]